MTPSFHPNLYLALLHHPVTNKSGEVVASAVTNLDLHDISRSARTFGVRRFYVVTPVTDQIALAKSIVEHWTQGPGARYNPQRQEALSLIRVTATLDDALDDAGAEAGARPQTVVTDAKELENAVSYQAFRNMAATGAPYMLLFGTAWGLTQDFVRQADMVLAPIRGHGAYNHLSVRSAAAIILDRILGTPDL